MKNQYVGDIGDFGKYSLLRAFCEAGVKVGINWYLTTDDDSNDGKFTGYLKKGDMRYLCPEVFDTLNGIADNPGKSVDEIKRSGILSNAVFYDELLSIYGNPSERLQRRKNWFSESMVILSDADLVFMDPDNGLLECDDASKPGAEKYILPSEIERCFKAGHNVVYYCHKGRRTFDAWQEYISLMCNRVPDAKPAVLTYHKGTQRSYVFLIHKEDFVAYRRIINGFLRGWNKIFTEEYINNGNPANEIVGEGLTINRSDGSVITINNRADGRIEIRDSSKPNMSQIFEPDMFCRLLDI